MGDCGRRERPEEGDLQRQVEQDPDDDRTDHRAGHVTARVARFGAELYRLLEAGEREDHTERQCRQDAFPAERHEARRALPDEKLLP